MEGYLKFLDPRVFKVKISMKLNWNFLEGGECKTFFKGGGGDMDFFLNTVNLN